MERTRLTGGGPPPADPHRSAAGVRDAWLPGRAHRGDRPGAGCSEPMLYKHFPSKQALFAAVLADARTPAEERVATDRRWTHANGLDAPGCWPWQSAPPAIRAIIEPIRLRMLAVSLVDVPEVRAAIDTSPTDILRAHGLDPRPRRPWARARRHRPEDAAWLWFGFTLAGGFAHAVQEPRSCNCAPMAHTFAALLRRTTRSPRRRMMTNDHPNHKWWTLFAMCFALFMIMLDNTIVNVALPSIQRALHTDPGEPRVDDQRLRPHVRRADPARRQAR